jgi:hypothetical protein
MYNDNGGKAWKFTACDLSAKGCRVWLVMIAVMPCDLGKSTGYEKGRLMLNLH